MTRPEHLRHHPCPAPQVSAGLWDWIPWLPLLHWTHTRHGILTGLGSPWKLAMMGKHSPYLFQVFHHASEFLRCTTVSVKRVPSSANVWKLSPSPPSSSDSLSDCPSPYWMNDGGVDNQHTGNPTEVVLSFCPYPKEGEQARGVLYVGSCRSETNLDGHSAHQSKARYWQMLLLKI